MSAAPRARLAAFLPLAFTLSWAWQAHILSAGFSPARAILGMWCPGLAALLVGLATRRRPAEFGWRLGPFRYLAAGYLLPVAYAGTGYALVWLAGLGGFPAPRLLNEIRGALGLHNSPDWVPLLIGCAATATLIPAVGAFAALGEEIGWRGFLVPELHRVYGFTTTALVSGAVWAVWHYPLLLGGAGPGGPPAGYRLGCFTLLIVALSFPLTWLRLRSGSLWPAVTLHAVHNAVIQQLLTPLTSDTGPTPYWVDETGAALLPFAFLAAFYFWRRRGELAVVPARPPRRVGPRGPCRPASSRTIVPSTAE